MPTVGSLFAGIGGFDLGLERAGWLPAWQVEIDPHAQAVSRYHWPDVERHSDVCAVGAAALPRVDLLCGGFPCQDLSVAGRRAGLAGKRSGLFYEFMRLAAELAPRWVLIENVGGLLSSNGGRDMGAVIGALAERGYGWVYRCLDTQHFGCPQRRYRVFIVGHLGGFCPPEVLLEPDCLPGDSAARRAAGEGVAATLTRGVESGGRGGYAGRRREDDVNLVARPLASHASSYRVDVDTAENLVAPCLTSNYGKQPDNSDTAAGPMLVPLAFNWQFGGDCRVNPSESGTDALHVGQVPAVLGFALNQRREQRVGEQTDALHEPSGTQLAGAITPMGVRRLTPRECEALQGFPPDWTRYGRREDGAVYELKDAPRYRLLGNAVSVPVAEWIARRILVEGAAR